ncbi:MAG: UDP-3-O-(3-hydroxymyristoyl)glucosamine N-acyltransferase [Bacteroidia bacterium]|nr:UDP-3-O-(3-hydroxymyristoyl)glucosamine N-acyltransferase [Bacteroidia bacterium]MDW8157308.1 UDP-3-O-(3-hydroxymyristoyl)glucosamine N-acyltransferase [Bacteroidia bacterium]
MEYTVSQIAEMVEGTIEGETNRIITHLATIEEGKEGALCFLQNPKYLTNLHSSQATAVLVPIDFMPKNPVTPTLIRCQEPYLQFVKLMRQVAKPAKPKQGIAPTAIIEPSASIPDSTSIGDLVYIGANTKIGENVTIYPQVYLGAEVEIGDNTTIYPGVVIYHQVKIGKNCILHSGCVIGSDGFGYLQDNEGKHIKVPQIGKVIIEDDVEIGANTCIDRATLGTTKIAKGVKIDNLVHIAHNVSIGENTIMAAQVGISGSTRIGNHCMFGGQVGITGHVEIAEKTQLGAKAGVTKSIKKPGQILRGGPAQPLEQQLKQEALQRRLPELFERIQALEEKLVKIQSST